jgi:hypothetical protein
MSLRVSLDLPHFGLAATLGLLGTKRLLLAHVHVPHAVSLPVVAGVLLPTMRFCAPMLLRSLRAG